MGYTSLILWLALWLALVILVIIDASPLFYGKIIGNRYQQPFAYARFFITAPPAILTEHQ